MRAERTSPTESGRAMACDDLDAIDAEVDAVTDEHIEGRLQELMADPPELPPVCPARNRLLIAERLDWPPGALDRCIALEREHPLWSVYWTADGIDGERGYRANLHLHDWVCNVQEPTAAALDRRLTAVEGRLPAPREFPTPLSSLV